MKRMLITGGCGFIGANFVRFVLDNSDYEICVLDALTYAGRKDNLPSNPDSKKRLEFVHGNIDDVDCVNRLFKTNDFDIVFNFAAESHVDRSIESTAPFIQSNIVGTHTLLEAAMRYDTLRFVQISSDEVYGSLDLEDDAFTEGHPIEPNSPYSASKASADLLIRSYHHTFGFPAIITRCSNNYGPYQHVEKFIPKIVTNAMRDKSIPVYGKGKNIRDWIYVSDHCEAIWLAGMKGVIGEVYNIGSGNELENIEIVKFILDVMGKPHSLIEFVTDRLGHDLRYAMNYDKISKELSWSPWVDFLEGIRHTVNWYRQNKSWWESVKTSV